jgi:hypothetical protein
VTTHAPATAVFGASFVVSATASSGLAVTFSSSGGCTNTGTTYTMTSSTAACVVRYDQAGNANYNAASQVTENVIAQGANTTTTLISVPNPSIFGQPVTFTATVAPSAATGTVQFYADGTLLGPVRTLTSGQATYITNTLWAGAHVITATYSGDTYYSTSNGTLSPNQQVNKAAATITLGNLSQTYDGTTKPITSTTTPLGLTVVVTYTGTSGTVYGPTTAAPTNAGTYRADAAINDANYQGTATDTLVIAKANTTTTLASSLNPSLFGQSVTFTATVTSTAGTPGGTVTFTVEGGTPITRMLDGAGQATYSIASLTPGACTIRVEYVGNANYAGSVGTFTQNVSGFKTYLPLVINQP